MPTPLQVLVGGTTFFVGGDTTTLSPAAPSPPQSPASTPVPMGPPSALTANHTTAIGETGTHFSTIGATGGVTVTVPANLIVGARYRFSHVAGTGIHVVLPAKNYALDGFAAAQYGSATTTVTLSHSTNFAHMELELIGVDSSSNYLWMITAKSGTWTAA